MQSIKKCLDQVKAVSPLTLSITNQVTINDCANGLLAIGGSPVMSDDPQDARALAEMASATVINIGTTNEYKLELMLAAISGAKKTGKPIVLDPVGVGATDVRRKTALTLIDRKPDIIRGNYSEIKALSGLTIAQKGVDSIENDDPAIMAEVAGDLSRALKAIVAVTGATDVVAENDKVSFISGGTPLLTRLTGTGCMLSAIAGAYAGANPENLYDGMVAALIHMSLAGERARDEIGGDRLGSFRVKLFDHLTMIGGDDLAAFSGVKVL